MYKPVDIADITAARLYANSIYVISYNLYWFRERFVTDKVSRPQ